jgi:hypothetical protein
VTEDLASWVKGRELCSRHRNDRHKPEGKECIESTDDVNGGEIERTRERAKVSRSLLCTSVPPSTQTKGNEGRARQRDLQVPLAYSLWPSPRGDAPGNVKRLLCCPKERQRCAQKGQSRRDGD